MTSNLRILLVEDNPEDARLTGEMLAGICGDVPVKIATSLDQARDRLREDGVDVVLFALRLPDGWDSATFEGLRASWPDVPVVVLSGIDDEAIALKAVQGGAQDYLVKGHVDARLLSHSLRHAIERQKLQRRLLASDKKYNQILEDVSEGVLAIDARGVVTFANARMGGMLGYAVSEMVGKDLFSFMSEDMKAEAERLVGARRRRILEAREFAFLRKDGSRLHTLLNIAPKIDERGEYVGAMALVSDLSLVKEREAELEQIEERYRQAQKLKAIGRLAGGVAHDFSNFLTVILGHSELLAAELKDRTKEGQRVEEIVKAGEHAAALTRQLLAFGRRQVLEPRVLDVGEVVASDMEMLRRLIGEDVELVMEKEKDLGKVLVDPEQIGQVVMNLVVNSRDAMPRGGRIVIGLHNVDSGEMPSGAQEFAKPGGHVVLSVADTGCGMSDEVKSRLFEPFFTTKGREKGTGLGLSTVYGIVEQSGGLIWVESEIGKGTKFSVYLPAVKVDQAQIGAGAVVKRANRHVGKETIMVAENRADVRRVICEMLRSHGFIVLDVPDALGAMGMLAEKGKKIDLLLAGNVVGEREGVDVVKSFRKLHPSAKILYMAGYTDKALPQFGALKEGEFLLAKPFDSETLTRKVREVLDFRSATLSTA